MKIGNYEIDKALFLAPLEDYTDIVFRKICRDRGADVVVTEFAAAEALVRDSDKTFEKLKLREEERPVGIQIFGAQIESMVGAAKVAEKFKPDFIDINGGCWVPKVAKQGAGAALLKDPDFFVSLAREVVRAVDVPVTVKTRLGWDRSNIVIVDLARRLEDVGVQCLFLHCRTRDMKHGGEADWSWLPRVKEVLSIPLVGNGDVRTVEDIERMFSLGVDGVMIGRGAIGHPWIFEEGHRYLNEGVLPSIVPFQKRIDLCKEHFLGMVDLKGESRGLREFRKYYGSYLKGIANIANVRKKLVTSQSVDEIMGLLNGLGGL